MRFRSENLMNKFNVSLNLPTFLNGYDEKNDVFVFFLCYLIFY